MGCQHRYIANNSEYNQVQYTNSEQWPNVMANLCGINKAVKNNCQKLTSSLHIFKCSKKALPLGGNFLEWGREKMVLHKFSYLGLMLLLCILSSKLHAL